MTTIFEAIKESHEKQRELCRKLTAHREDKTALDDIFFELKLELAAHAASEERYLYAVILMDDNGLAPSRHALSEHHEIEELSDALSVKDKTTDAWHEKAKELTKTVHHHLKEEESRFFQQAGKILTETQKTTLAKKYLEDIERMRDHLRKAG